MRLNSLPSTVPVSCSVCTVHSACVSCSSSDSAPTFVSGAGKTYTMGTAASVKDVAGKSGGPAVVPKAVHRLMEYVSHASKAYDIIVKVGKGMGHAGCYERTASME